MWSRSQSRLAGRILCPYLPRTIVRKAYPFSVRISNGNDQVLKTINHDRDLLGFWCTLNSSDSCEILVKFQSPNMNCSNKVAGPISRTLHRRSASVYHWTTFRNYYQVHAIFRTDEISGWYHGDSRSCAVVKLGPSRVVCDQFCYPLHDSHDRRAIFLRI